MMRRLLITVAAVFAVGCTNSMRMSERDVAPEIEKTDVFVSGEGGYHTYRIPALCTAPDGSILAFCEGRKNGRGDAGNIDLLLRRSRDGGRTWGAVQLLVDDGENTCGNPAPVLDTKTGTLFLLQTRNPGKLGEGDVREGRAQRTAWVMHSTDSGATWSEPVEITADVKAPNWRWYATGPGHGIQLSSGRLLIPCDHSDASSKGQTGGSHTVTSDDGGASWRIGGIAGIHMNECMAAELDDGSVYMNMRNERGFGNRRGIARSYDGGISWREFTRDETLIEPVCQASVLAPDWRGDAVLFCNPASLKRENLTVRLSRDGARTWPVARVLHPGPTAYSDLVALPGGDVGCLYENGDKNAYERITWARFNQAWLE